MEIKSTKNYKLFKTVRGNRRINDNHLRNLTTSIMHKNMLAVNPIIVNRNMEVIDGQHRLEVAKNSDLDIFYVVIKEGELSDVQRMNRYVKSWTLIDFINSYIEKGNQHYVVLKSFIEEYGLTPSTAALLLIDGGMKTRPTYSVIDDIREGTFEVRSSSRAYRVANRLMLIRDYVLDNAWRTREFIYSLNIVCSKVEFEKLVHKLETSGIKIQKQDSVKDYLRAFEDLYNWKSRSDSIRFF